MTDVLRDLGYSKDEGRRIVTPVNSPVIDLILKRAHEGSKPGHREDQNKLGLAIEGGAMRGVVTAGMVTGLERLGLRDSFDVVYGSSSGASNGARFENVCVEGNVCAFAPNASSAYGNDSGSPDSGGRRFWSR